MKGKNRNWVGILSDQGGAATASNLSEYTTPMLFLDQIINTIVISKGSLSSLFRHRII